MSDYTNEEKLRGWENILQLEQLDELEWAEQEKVKTFGVFALRALMEKPAVNSKVPCPWFYFEEEGWFANFEDSVKAALDKVLKKTRNVVGGKNLGKRKRESVEGTAIVDGSGNQSPEDDDYDYEPTPALRAVRGFLHARAGMLTALEMTMPSKEEVIIRNIANCINMMEFLLPEDQKIGSFQYPDGTGDLVEEAKWVANCLRLVAVFPGSAQALSLTDQQAEMFLDMFNWFGFVEDERFSQYIEEKKRKKRGLVVPLPRQ